MQAKGPSADGRVSGGSRRERAVVVLLTEAGRMVVLDEIGVR